MIVDRGARKRFAVRWPRTSRTARGAPPASPVEGERRDYSARVIAGGGFPRPHGFEVRAETRPTGSRARRGAVEPGVRSQGGAR